MKITRLFLIMSFICVSLFPHLSFGATAPLYTKIQKVDGNTAYMTSGILGAEKLFSCTIDTLSCLPVDKIPAVTSLAETAVQKIVFKNADKSILISFSFEQGVTTGFFYHKDDYTAYKTVILPFIPTKALFSRDGNSVVLFGTQNGEPSLFRLPFSTYVPESVQSFSLDDIYTLNLSPNGMWLAYYKAASDTQRIRTIGFYSLESKKHYTTTSRHIYWDLLKEVNREFAFSADSSYVAYLDDRDGFQRAYVLALKTTMKDAKGVPAGKKGLTTQDITFSGSTLLFVHNEKDPYQWNLSKYDVKKQQSTLLASSISYGDNIEVSGNYVLAEQERNNAYVPVRIILSSGEVSSFLFNGVLPEGAVSATDVPLLKRELITSGTLKGNVIQKTTLKKTDKKPVVIWLHGGPFRQSARILHPYQSYGVYDWALDDLAETGAVRILKLDYRGSFAFGTALASKMQTEVGRGDMNDVLQMLATFKKKYPTTKVYLVGNSYGGYLALRTLVGNPLTITGAFSINGVTDWKDLLYQYQNSIFNTLFYGPPGKGNKYLYDRASIISRINKLKQDDKVYILQSSRDDTVFPSQATLFTNAMAKLGKAYDYTSLLGENHVLAKPESVVTVCTKLYAFVGTPSADHCAFVR